MMPSTAASLDRVLLGLAAALAMLTSDRIPRVTKLKRLALVQIALR
jgi:hypothetical protein